MSKSTTKPLTKKNDGNFKDYYILQNELGSGAFAKVYKCEKKADKTSYACKVVHKNLILPGSKNSMSWDTELRINNKLHHLNIVNMIEMFEKPKLSLIFDLCKGGDLFDDIEKRQKYTEKDAAQCMFQILSGTKYIHDNKIIHRDLKPENLLLTEDGTIKIGDFGLAVEIDEKKGQAYGTAGSPDYIAPEIINKKYYNYKVDVWSCGVILYILLCGYPPFGGKEDIKKGKVLFYVDDWKHICVPARTLIVQMLTVCQDKRLSAAECLQSQWMTADDLYNTTDLNVMKTKLRSYNAKRKLKGAIRGIIAANRLRFSIGGQTTDDSIKKQDEDITALSAPDNDNPNKPHGSKFHNFFRNLSMQNRDNSGDSDGQGSSAGK